MTRQRTKTRRPDYRLRRLLCLWAPAWLLGFVVFASQVDATVGARMGALAVGSAVVMVAAAVAVVIDWGDQR